MKTFAFFIEATSSSSSSWAGLISEVGLNGSGWVGQGRPRALSKLTDSNRDAGGASANADQSHYLH
jgi:hypothetical protein